MFCTTHQQQAKLFAAAFAEGGSPEGGDTTEASLPEVAPPPENSRSSRGTTRSRRTRRLSTTTTSLRREEELLFDPSDTSREALAYRINECLEKVRNRAREQGERDGERWPQISVYTLYNEVIARPYYSIIPRAAKAATMGEGAGSTNRDDSDLQSAGHTYRVTDNRIIDAMANGGVVFDAFADLFEDRLHALQERQVQTLNIHFLTYAGLIAINEHLPDQRERNLTTFYIQGSEFVETPAEEVRHRLHHERW